MVKLFIITKLLVKRNNIKMKLITAEQTSFEFGKKLQAKTRCNNDCFRPVFFFPDLTAKHQIFTEVESAKLMNDNKPVILRICTTYNINSKDVPTTKVIIRLCTNYLYTVSKTSTCDTLTGSIMRKQILHRI